MARSSRRCAGATARKPHARALHARTKTLSGHGTRERATREPLRKRTPSRPHHCATCVKRRGLM
eukprot:9455659-Lingulodinium_polyedra.AAC.1